MIFTVIRRPPHGGRGLKFNNANKPELGGYSRPPHGGRGLKSESILPYVRTVSSLPARGAWIEISALRGWLYRASVSLPARGAWIEMLCIHSCMSASQSLPARGAWIEILATLPAIPVCLCRSPHGERGLKYGMVHLLLCHFSRSPHGERGLKSVWLWYRY